MQNQKLVQNRKDHGFTLIELMITVIIIGILTAVALPSFRSFIEGQRIKNASFDIMAMLTLTRSEAIKRNAAVTATLAGNDWSQGWVVTAADGTVLRRQSAMPGITAICMSGSSLLATACNSISYGGSGRSGNAQSIHIQISSVDTTGVSTRCISIDPSGRPNSKKGAC